MSETPNPLGLTNEELGNPQRGKNEAGGTPWETKPNSGELVVDPAGDPRCPDCNGTLRRCGLDEYLCRKCGEGWTLTPINEPNTGVQ